MEMLWSFLIFHFPIPWLPQTSPRSPLTGLLVSPHQGFCLHCVPKWSHSKASGARHQLWSQTVITNHLGHAALSVTLLELLGPRWLHLPCLPGVLRGVKATVLWVMFCGRASGASCRRPAAGVCWNHDNLSSPWSFSILFRNAEPGKRTGDDFKCLSL